MKLQQLRYLVAIVDNGLNITAASDVLFTSQPGVSKQIKMLEDELSLQLFIRKGKSLSGLTDAGKRVVSRARRMLAEAGTKPGETSKEAWDAAYADALESAVKRCSKEKEEVIAAGGLMIIGTERHESRRIDNQLRGRAGPPDRDPNTD